MMKMKSCNYLKRISLQLYELSFPAALSFYELAAKARVNSNVYVFLFLRDCYMAAYEIL
jgi:hypothetical protein